jgi:hypothetical protein
MAAASANECPAANALVSAGRSFDAESPDLRRERHAQSRLCRRGALGPQAVPANGPTTPTFRTASFYKNGPFVSAGLVGHPRTRAWVGRAINGRHWVSREGSAVASGRRVCFEGDRGRRIDVRKGIPFLDESGGPPRDRMGHAPPSTYGSRYPPCAAGSPLPETTINLYLELRPRFA